MYTFVEAIMLLTSKVNEIQNDSFNILFNATNKNQTMCNKKIFTIYGEQKLIIKYSFEKSRTVVTKLCLTQR